MDLPTHFIELYVPRALAGYGFPPCDLYRYGKHGPQDVNVFLKAMRFSDRIFNVPKNKMFSGMSRYALERNYEWVECKDITVTRTLNIPDGWHMSDDGFKYRVVGFKDFGIDPYATWYEDEICPWRGAVMKKQSIKHEYDHYTIVVEKTREKIK